MDALLAAAGAVDQSRPDGTSSSASEVRVDGLTLQRANNTAGYKGVTVNSHNKTRPYEAKVTRNGAQLSLGHFRTAEAAALCYAQNIAVHGAPKLSKREASEVARAAALTAEEALRQAAAEGLTLHKSDNTSGYLSVSYHGTSKALKKYSPKVWRDGKPVLKGVFATAEEAALAYARDVAVHGGPPPDRRPGRKPKPGRKPRGNTVVTVVLDGVAVGV